MATDAAWMRAFSETDFSALTNGVPPATLDHESLLGLGLKKCSDRKAILRRFVIYRYIYLDAGRVSPHTSP